MADRKIFAGHAMRRLRRAAGLTQVALAEALDISPSYLNLLERNQRPLSAGLMLRLAERFDFDPRQLGDDVPGGGIDALRRRLADPMFADLSVDRSEIEEWLAAAPGGADAFARAYDRMIEGTGATDRRADTSSVTAVRREIERWRNHFADLDTQAETLSDELRMTSADLYGALSERLRTRHQLTIRILPADVMPGTVRRLDLHARQLQLSEMLDGASRTFQAAWQIADLEVRKDIDALVSGAAFTDRTAERLFRRHVTSYFAAALMMPYGRFLRACETSGYDFLLLQRRFGAGFEQVAHRLTTLQRVGARGLPFFMMRLDRSGQISKRYAGASGARIVDAPTTCPLWSVHESFDRPSRILAQLIELEDGERWFTLSRCVTRNGTAGPASTATFVIAMGVQAQFAKPLLAAHGLDLTASQTAPIGLGCAACTRTDCAQRSAPPAGRPLRFNDRERGVSPFDFATD